MKCFCDEIENQKVFPIVIKNNGNRYLTLYYYTVHSDSVLHSNTKRILYFQSVAAMEAFCTINELQVDDEIVEYDFDALIENPVDYTQILNHWNLLNTIASTFGMFFEGDHNKYTSTYELLFKLSMTTEPFRPLYRLRQKDYKAILRVFRKKDRFLKLLELYSEESSSILY